MRDMKKKIVIILAIAFIVVLIVIGNLIVPGMGH
jgi:hypothetical protein